MKKIILISICLLAYFYAFSQEANVEKITLPSARISCGPWIQAASETEFTVVWTTTVNSAVWVEVAPDDGTHFYAKERPRYYQSHFGRRPTGTLHQVKISGLEKGTSYRYRIFQQAVLADEGNKRVVLGEPFGSDILKQKPYKVTTLDGSKNTCNFSIVNDIHANDSLLVELTKNIKPEEVDFMVFNGDMLTQIENRRQIEDGYLRSASMLFAGNMPLYAVRGNHEFRGSASYDFMSFFPTTTGLPYYTVKEGSVFTIFLDSGEDKTDQDIRFYGLSLTDQMREEQAEWLKKVVVSDDFKNASLRFVVIHMPPVSNGWHGPSEVNRLFVPILNEAGIDMMFCGHEHKLRYIKPGDQVNKFPILVNSNKHRVDVKVKDGVADIVVVDAKGKVDASYKVQR